MTLTNAEFAAGIARTFTVAPLPADFAAAIQQFEIIQSEMAAAQLKGNDPYLNPIRSKVRSSVEPLLKIFENQLADVRNRAKPPATIDSEAEVTHGRLRGAYNPDHPAHDEYEALRKQYEVRGTLTEHGLRKAEAEIEANRAVAIEGALKPLRMQLERLESRFEQESKERTPKWSIADVDRSTKLRDYVAGLAPRHGVAFLADHIKDLANQSNYTGARVALAMLKSMYESEGTAWHGNDDLLPLINATEKLTTPWDQTVARARLERVQHVKADLDTYAEAALKRNEAALRATDDEGDFLLFPAEAAPVVGTDTAPVSVSQQQPPATPAPGMSAERRQRDMKRARLAHRTGDVDWTNDIIKTDALVDAAPEE
jgi:hypothetical protein